MYVVSSSIAAPGPDQYHGKILQYAEWTFKTAADKATFVEAVQPAYAQLQQEGWAFCVDMGETSVYVNI